MTEEKKNIKLYVATLNGGTLRREWSWQVFPTLCQTEGVDIIWENPGLTWANPISSNRNLITQRFLESDCDFMMQLDDDVVPLCNPAELCHADKDIIGLPARVRSTGQTICWTVYRDHPSGEAFSAVDFTQLDDMMDLMEVEIIGTGCVIVARRVLEALKAPFHSEFDDDGIQIYGTDFAFCRKARAHGFTVYTAPNHLCEHFKKVGLTDHDGWDNVRHFDKSNTPYEIPWGGWAITQKDWKFIKDVIREIQPKRILEFGAGLSSLLMSEMAEVITYETNDEYIETVHNKIIENKLFIRKWGGTATPTISEDFDMAFVDGPPGEGTGGPGRDNSIRIAAEKCDVILCHDSGRQAERHWIRTHLRGKFARIRNSGDHETNTSLWVRRDKPVTNANYFETEPMAGMDLVRK